MRKKLFCLMIGLAAVFGAASVLTTPAEAKSCPKGSHLVHCPGRSICCPDGFICDCLPK